MKNSKVRELNRAHRVRIAEIRTEVLRSMEQHLKEQKEQEKIINVCVIRTNIVQKHITYAERTGTVLDAEACLKELEEYPLP